MVSGISDSFLWNPEISLVVNFLTNGLFHVLQMIITRNVQKSCEAHPCTMIGVSLPSIDLAYWEKKLLWFPIRTNKGRTSEYLDHVNESLEAQYEDVVTIFSFSFSLLQNISGKIYYILLFFPPCRASLPHYHPPTAPPGSKRGHP